MSDPYRVSDDILNQTSQPSKAPTPSQPYQTSQDILHATRQETTQGEQTEPEPINPEDLYDRFGHQDDKPKPSSRWDTLKQRAASSIDKLEQKYPKTAETVRLLGRYTREKGKERLEKAAARQAAGTSIPAWGNAAMGAYEAWDTYKDVKAFIQHAKTHPDLKPSNLKKQEKPYYQLVQEKREADAKKLEKSLWQDVKAQYGKAEYKDLIGQQEYFNGMTPNEVGTQIRSQSDRIRYVKPTTSEQLSQIASRHPQAMEQYRTKSEQWAKEYELNGHQGNARQEYHWMLQEAEKELGKGYFNPETNPKGVLAYEKFANTHLRAHHSQKEQNKARAYGIVGEVLTQENQSLRESVRKTNPELYEQTKKIRDGEDITARESAFKQFDPQKPQELFTTPEKNQPQTPTKNHDLDEIERWYLRESVYGINMRKSNHVCDKKLTEEYKKKYPLFFETTLVDPNAFHLQKGFFVKLFF